MAARPSSVRLADAVVEAIVDQYTGTGSHDPGALLMITTRPALRDAFLGTAAQMTDALAAVIAERLGARSLDTAQVLSASVAAAVRIALQRWVQSGGAPPAASGLVAASGSLGELLRAALAPLVASLNAAERRP